LCFGKWSARRSGEVLTDGKKEASGLDKLSKKQDFRLLAEGFERAEGSLWRRNGVYFGREAAMQNAQSSLLQRGGYAIYDHPPRAAEEGKAV
jgi:hypothetical protein